MSAEVPMELYVGCVVWSGQVRLGACGGWWGRACSCGGVLACLREECSCMMVRLAGRVAGSGSISRAAQSRVTVARRWPEGSEPARQS